jgi:hypothetical protein
MTLAGDIFMMLYCPLGAFVIVSGWPANACDANMRLKIKGRHVFIISIAFPVKT